ncbi:MAG: asparagine synthetase B, partial [Hyphomicrobiales bacterium]|nr:asparagine synthetase B [Hyphomicrobiales bacterium]
MGAALVHRGPDGGDIWVDAEAGIGFAHRRLSIIDLSDAGKKPMYSASGRYVFTYNGEIYNFGDLRRQLESNGNGLRVHTDTEVMLEGFDYWRVTETLQRLIGKFALALWDRKTRTQTLVRDRLGIKP